MKRWIYRSVLVACSVLGLVVGEMVECREMPVEQESVNIPFEHFVLENGLNVYLIRDNALPIVTANLWFNVGSKDEQAGRTGFAHLFEHLMFMGTDAVPDIDILLESGGGSNNASTREEVTNYYTVAPENMLEMVLYIEADRFAHLDRAMTQEKLDKQRDVVLNERRQSYENQPYGKLWLEMPEAMYPVGHPYAHSVIGSVEDLKAATVDDVVSFFRTYYVPSNVTLVVAGDFEPEKARAWVEKYFSMVESRPKPPVVEVPQMTHPVKSRVVIEDDVQTPRLTLVWHSPAFMTPGDAELDIFSSILCKGQNSRLVNRLVYEKQLASSVSCAQMSGSASMFLIDAMPVDGVSIDVLEKEIVEEIDAILKDGVTVAEFEQTKNGIETQFVKQLQSIGSRADSFNSHLFYTGRTDFPEGDLNRYRTATVDGLMAVAREILSDPMRRCAFIVVPKGNEKASAESVKASGAESEKASGAESGRSGSESEKTGAKSGKASGAESGKASGAESGKASGAESGKAGGAKTGDAP